MQGKATTQGGEFMRPFVLTLVIGPLRIQLSLNVHVMRRKPKRRIAKR